jgi:hypothetical protein
MKRTRKYLDIIEHIQQKFQKKIVSGKNIVRDESTVEFKHKIIFETYNPKIPTKWGIRLLALAESVTGHVHSIIPNYGKLTGNVCNLPYSKNSSFQEPFFH